MMENVCRRFTGSWGVGLLAGIMLALAGTAGAGQFYERQGVAIDGFDPVAYFEDHKAVKGLPALSHRYKGSTFLFASAAHREAFAQTPERFAPQFGGFCAYGIAEGVKAKSDGDVWAIVAGKLYLNYDSTIQRKWIGGKEVFIREAEASWPTVQTTTAVHQ